MADLVLSTQTCLRAMASGYRKPELSPTSFKGIPNYSHRPRPSVDRLTDFARIRIGSGGLPTFSKGHAESIVGYLLSTLVILHDLKVFSKFREDFETFRASIIAYFALLIEMPWSAQCSSSLNRSLRSINSVELETEAAFLLLLTE